MAYFSIDYKARGAAAVALEDSIMRRGEPVTAGSKMLAGFTAPFDAAVVTRLLQKQFTIAGRTAMPEFGIADFAAAGGDFSAGAVSAVADNAAAFALCNDLFGIYRSRAAEQGLCYIHPTYGTVSRFGLVPAASSMDQIGVLCKSPREGFGLLSVIAGNDEKDGAMFPEKSYSYSGGGKTLTAAVPDNFEFPAGLDFAENFTVKKIHLPHFEVYKQVMYILSCAEISNNISRYDGVKFGFRTPDYKNLEELYVKSRTRGFGPNAKLAAIMGALVLSQEHYVPLYEKAMKIRRLVREALAFDGYDVLVLPAAAKDPYDSLALYAPAALAGLPSITFSRRGNGIQLAAKAKNENALFSAWEAAQ